MTRSMVWVLLVMLAILGFFAVAGYVQSTKLPQGTPTPTATALAGQAGSPSPDLAAQGAALARQFGCLSCHTTDGRPAAGPTFKGLYGSQLRLTTGQTVTADAAYLRESITDPDAKIVAGYAPGVMSNAIFQEQRTIRDGNNLDALVAYIESLK